MKIICVMVESIDGKTTHNTDSHIHLWTSKEDQEYFGKTIKEAECLIMGRKTYDAAKSMMKHMSGRLRVVLTRNPEEYKNEAIPNQLEFTSNAPGEIIEQLEKRGITKALLVGGASLNTEFLKENLIDELWLTIEPVILGEGNPLFAGNEQVKNLNLLSLERLNDKGTLLLKYRLQSSI